MILAKKSPVCFKHAGDFFAVGNARCFTQHVLSGSLLLFLTNRR